MAEPASADGDSKARVRILHPVPADADDADADPTHRLAAELAAALRAVRGFVPQRIWWESGAAEALLAYQAIEETTEGVG